MPAINFDVLAEAIADVESGGRADAVGRAGERGLMQIKSVTWRETSLRIFQRAVPYSRAFEPRMNLLIGRAYLQHLNQSLIEEQHRLQDDMLPLLVASYNNGPERIVSLGYSLTDLSPERKNYVRRVLNLHRVYSAERLGAREVAERRSASIASAPAAAARQELPRQPDAGKAKPVTASASAGALGLVPVVILGMGWAAYRRRRYVLATEGNFLGSLTLPRFRPPSFMRR